MNFGSGTGAAPMAMARKRETPAAADEFFGAPLAEADPELHAAIRGELGRLREHIELIASENVVSAAVLEAQGSVLTNKYAEGYPGRRYYGGCEHVDVAEALAIDRAKQLFGCGFANVQPHSGAQANGAVYVDVYTPSIGRDACAAASTRWVEPLVPANAAAPVHPNARGMDGMAAAVAAAIRAHA